MACYWCLWGDTTDDDTTGLFGTNSKALLVTDESNKVLKDRKNVNDSSTVGTMEDQKTKDSEAAVSHMIADHHID